MSRKCDITGRLSSRRRERQVPRYWPVCPSRCQLSYSQDIQRRVAQVGFDWEDIDGIIDKLTEEVNEFKRTESQEQRAQEFGDLLFTLVNIARRLEIDLEAALRETNRKFYRRFSYMEEVCRKRGLNLAELSFDEQNALWEEAKRKSQNEGAGRGERI